MALYSLPLLFTKQETPFVTSFVFDNTEGLSYLPGQFTDLYLPINDTPSKRSFSLSSSPTEKNLMVTMRNSDKPFKELLSKKQTGDLISVTQPLGKFVLEQDLSKHHVFIAGGIGITPFRSMITYMKDTNPSYKATLIHSNRIPSDIIFKDDVFQIQQAMNDFSVYYTITQQDDTWEGPTGRITHELLREVLVSPSNCIVYICGLPRMVVDMVKLVKETGVEDSNIRFELFTGY